MAVMIYPLEAKQNIFNQIFNGLGLNFNNAHVHLFDNVLTLDNNTVLTDFNEASYTPYTDFDWVTPPSIGSDTLGVQPANASFPQSTTGLSLMQGFYVTDNADGHLFGCGNFDGGPFDVSIGPLFIHIESNLFDVNS